MTTKIMSSTGYISLQDLADFWGIAPANLRKALKADNVHIIRAGQKYAHQIVSLEDLRHNPLDEER